MSLFAPGFSWGVATSAYQIEGAVADGGRTPSVWDTFSGGGATACDHYHRWREDLDLLAELGVTAYRFSVAWSRIQPDPTGTPNPEGLAFYDRLLDGLHERGIEPVLNLFHWDTPQWVQDRGGWQSRETAERFAEYAAVAAERFGDRVGMWCTVNEMFEHCVLGHLTGEHAPGLTLPLQEAFGVAHHLLLGHGRAAGVLHADGRAPVMVINSYAPARAATDSDADRGLAELYDQLQNHLFTEPVLRGRYPAQLAPALEPFVRDGDLAVIAAPVDALGVNYYSINAVRAGDGPVPLEVVAPQGYPQTACGWAVAPDGLRETLCTLHDRYGAALPPLYVTENGCAYDDTADGHDPDRIRYLDGHIRAVGDAIAAGVDVRGYHVWSLLDNFEWAEGFTKRFGLVHVDFSTQRRRYKDSFHWYRGLIRRNGSD